MYNRSRGQAEWWRLLEVLGVLFDHRLLGGIEECGSSSDQSAGYAITLLPAFLDRCCGAALRKLHALARAFSAQFMIDIDTADLVFADGVLRGHQKASHQQVHLEEEPERGEVGLEVPARIEAFLVQTLTSTEVAYLDIALFGHMKWSDSSSQPQTRTDKCVEVEMRQSALDLTQRRQLPLLKVYRLLTSVLPTLAQQDYEAIEYVSSALLRTHRLAMMRTAVSPCVSSGPCDESKTGSPIFPGLPLEELRMCKKHVEIISLLNALKICLPMLSIRDCGAAPVASCSPHQRIPLNEVISTSFDVRRTTIMSLVDGSSVHKVSPLSRALDLRDGECYALLLRARFMPLLEQGAASADDSKLCTPMAAMTSNTSRSKQMCRLPSRIETAQWLMEIGDPTLASETAEWIVEQLRKYHHPSPRDYILAVEGALQLTHKWVRAATEPEAPSAFHYSWDQIKTDAISSGGELRSAVLAEKAIGRVSRSLLMLRNEEAIRSVDPTLLFCAIEHQSGFSLPSSLSLSRTEVVSQTSEASIAGRRTHFCLRDYLADPVALVVGLYIVASDRAIAAASVRMHHAHHAEIRRCLVGENAHQSHACGDSRGGYGSNAFSSILYHLENFPCTVAAFHAFAQEVSRAADTIAAPDMQGVQERLVREWLERPLSVALSSNAILDKGNISQQQVDGSASVFRTPNRILIEAEDEEVALRIAFLLGGNATSTSCCVGVPRKQMITVLLETAFGRSTSFKQNTRTQLRALRALALLASPGVIANAHAEALATEQPRQQPVTCHLALANLAVHGVRLGQAAWLEELRLPTTGLLCDGLGVPLVRALWRDHLKWFNMRHLLPVLCDIVLCVAAEQYGCGRGSGDVDYLGWAYPSTRHSALSNPHMAAAAGPKDERPPTRNDFLCEDVQLWLSVLRSMRDCGLWRDLLQLLPRLSLFVASPEVGRQFSSITVVLGGCGSCMDGLEDEIFEVWNQTLRRPLEELEERQSRSNHKKMKGNFGDEVACIRASMIKPVLDMVVSGIQTSPFLNRLDLEFFVRAIAATQGGDFSPGSPAYRVACL